MSIYNSFRNKMIFVLRKLKWSKASLGRGSFIELSAFASNPKNIILGDNSYISCNVCITNDYGFLSLGKNSHIAPGTIVNCYKANIRCGNNVAIGPNCSLIAHSNYYQPDKLITGTTVSKDIIFEDNVFIGANSVVLPGIRIGMNSIIAAGAVVVSDIPPNVIFGGTPAKFLKIRVYNSK